MRPLPATMLSALLCFAVPAQAQPTGAPAEKSNATPQKKPRPVPQAEWLDPDRGAPNGTQYRSFTSAVLSREVSYLVWLPPGYAEDTKRYPVIYWLHGMGANQRGGATMFVPHVEAAIRAGTLPPCIVVLVNGMVRSFYCDSSDGKIPLESVLIKDLIPHVDATYRTLARREGRVIEGFSMGGYGAAHLGFKYPELFGTVVINAGALLDPTLANVPKDGPMFAVFGEDRARRVAEHPLTLARQNAGQLRGRTHIRIGCGSLDGLLPRNQELHDLLTHLGIEHAFEIVPGVAHESPRYYRELGTKVYDFHRKSLAALTSTTENPSAPTNAPAGFKPLFDGHSLTGWQTAPRLGVPKTAGEALAPASAKQAPGKSAQENFKGRWDVRDGVISGGQDEQRFVHREDGADWGRGSWLMTDETYGDFELLVDARPDWPCDTGIYVRSTRLGQGFQILLDHRGDDPAGVGGSVGFLFLRGIGGFRVSPHNFRWTVGPDALPADVTLAPGTDGVAKMEFAATSEDFRRAWRLNDWNTFRIRVVGALPRITVWINGVKICGCDTAALQHPDYNPADVEKLLGPRGRIAFEVHDGPPWRWGIGKVSRWRNVFLKEL